MSNFQEASAVINEIAARNGGTVTPAEVVKAARSKDSPLHPYFTWDVKEAAQLRWLDEARALIRRVRVEVTVQDVTLQAIAYARDPRSDKQESRYVSTVEARSDEDLAREIVVNEFSRAAAHLRRAHHMARVLGMTEELGDLLDNLERLTHTVSYAQLGAPQ